MGPDDDDDLSLTVSVLPLLTPDGEGQRVVLDFGDVVETVDVPESSPETGTEAATGSS